MTLGYNNKKKLYYALTGIAWLTIGVAFLFITESAGIFHYGFIILGILSLLTYAYMAVIGYITIKDGRISKHILINKSMKLTDIQRIKRINDRYTLITANQEIRINTSWMDEEAIAHLDSALASK